MINFVRGSLRNHAQIELHRQATFFVNLFINVINAAQGNSEHTRSAFKAHSEITQRSPRDQKFLRDDPENTQKSLRDHAEIPQISPREHPDAREHSEITQSRG